MSKATAIKKALGGLGGLAHGFADTAAAHPAALAAGTYLGAQFVGSEVVAPVGKSVKDRLTGKAAEDFQAALELRRKERLTMDLERLKRERFERDIARNMASLATMNPQVYNQVLAGRRLPPEAIVIGGRKRTDFLETLAAAMADGQFSGPSTEEQLIQALGA